MSKALSAAVTKLQKDYSDTIRDVKVSGRIERIFLSSPQLNYLFGGGYPIGRITQLHGPESGGKSTLATYIGGEVQKLRPDHGAVVYMDFERSFEELYANRLGLDTSPEKFVFLRPENGEEGFTVLEQLVRTNEVGLVILDSDSTMPSKNQIEDAYGKATFGANARLMSDALRKFNPLLEKYKTSMILISQERANIGVTPGYGPDYKVTGGNAGKFYASVRNRVQRVDYVKEKGIITGIQMRVKNGKNKIGVPYREALLTLMFDAGFDIANEYMDFISSLGIVEQRGAYFKSEHYGFNLQGRAKLQEWLDTHPTEYAEIKLAVNEALCSENILDQDNVVEEEDSGFTTLGALLNDSDTQHE